MRERRAVLMSVRRAITRVALRAEDVLAIDVLSGLRAANAAGFQALKNKGRRKLAAGWGRLIEACRWSVNGPEKRRFQATSAARAAS
jgi:hypothetical protein